METIIREALPENFGELQKSREAANRKVTELTERAEDARAKAESMKSEAARLEKTLSESVGNGADSAPIMKKIRATKDALTDAERLAELSIEAANRAKLDIVATNRAMSEAFSGAVMTARERITGELQNRVDGIGADLDAWSAGVWREAGNLGVDVPESGLSIVLRGGRLRDAIT